MNKKPKKILKSGKEQIIKSALKIIGEDLDMKDYMIKVKASARTVIVLFHKAIVYVPLNTETNSDFGVDLIIRSSWSNIISNPVDSETDTNNIPRYIQTNEAQKHIRFVLNALNKSDEIASIDSKDFGFDDCMIIRDKKRCYDINMRSLHQQSFYKIDKRSGRVYDSRHVHLIAKPTDKGENFKDMF